MIYTLKDRNVVYDGVALISLTLSVTTDILELINAEVAISDKLLSRSWLVREIIKWHRGTGLRAVAPSSTNPSCDTEDTWTTLRAAIYGPDAEYLDTLASPIAMTRETVMQQLILQWFTLAPSPRKTTPNPFVEFELHVMGKPHAMASSLQSLVLHLYRGGTNPDIGALLRAGDEYHRALLLSLLTWYSEHGEGCREFMRIGNVLATSRS